MSIKNPINVTINESIVAPKIKERKALI